MFVVQLGWNPKGGQSGRDFLIDLL